MATSTQQTDDMSQDDIDLESLQAQIDLSMSLTHDLVMSWIKPIDKAALKLNSVDNNRFLEEHMRRPSRLGVGAPIPESSNMARDTARLKNRLTGQGKKRVREEGVSNEKSNPGSDDEEESRAGMIKKKMRLDPFGSTSKTHSAKKIEKGDAVRLSIGLPTPQLTPLATPADSQKETSEEQASDGMEVDDEDLKLRTNLSGVSTLPVDHPSDSPKRLKKKKKKRRKLAQSQKDQTPHIFNSSSSHFEDEPLPTPNSSFGSAGEMSPHSPASVNKSPVSFSGLTLSSFDQGASLADPSLTLRTKSSSVLPSGGSSSFTAGTSKYPIFNLDGPLPDLAESEEGKSNASTSPKKKRKRRKKKKAREARQEQEN